MGTELAVQEGTRSNAKNEETVDETANPAPHRLRDRYRRPDDDPGHHRLRRRSAADRATQPALRGERHHVRGRNDLRQGAARAHPEDSIVFRRTDAGHLELVGYSLRGESAADLYAYGKSSKALRAQWKAPEQRDRAILVASR